MRRLTILTILGFTLAACGPDPVSIDGSWLLVEGSWQGQEVPLLDAHPITLEVDGDHISGTAVCNGYGGDVLIDNGSFETIDVFQTEMACLPEEAMEAESIYIGALRVVDIARFDDGRLVLSGPDTELLFEPGQGASELSAAREPITSLFGPDTYGDWELRGGWIEGEPIPILDSHPITLTIDGNGIAGVAACNHYGGVPGQGGYSITEMACAPKEVMESESAYMEALAMVNKSVVEDGLLVVGHGESEVELIFESLDPVAVADLVGTVWVLEGLIQGDSITSSVGEYATLELFGDGSFIGATGCRHISGTYVVAGGAVQFTDFRAEGDCPADLSTQDSRVISALEGGFRVDIEEDRMTTWVAGDEGLVYRADP